ncbi:hypothetical protein R75461_07160 [Paraburkholderia nemoris]|nr:hypothetical protein R75461_07160 [Paraburkholderia nemoris]
MASRRLQKKAGVLVGKVLNTQKATQIDIVSGRSENTLLRQPLVTLTLDQF